MPMKVNLPSFHFGFFEPRAVVIPASAHCCPREIRLSQKHVIPANAGIHCGRST